MDNYPQNLIEQYLKASSKLKKFERVVFKRFAPNVSEVQGEFARLALKFEHAGIYQYAAMCQLGVAKCEMSTGNTVSECHAYLKAARAFMEAQNTIAALQLRSNDFAYRAGALRCYTQALERCPEDAVLKAAIIRELTSLQSHYDGTSSFASPAHRINELEMQAHVCCVQRRDFLGALQKLDDIVDNIYERKRQALYEELLERVEILRVLLLVALNLPPARQSPSHIKLIEYYYQLANFEDVSSTEGSGGSSGWQPGSYLPQQLKFALAEIVLAWLERKNAELKLSLEEFVMEFSSLNETQRFVLQCILKQVDDGA